MITKYAQEHWWIGHGASADEARVAAFKDVLQGKTVQFYHNGQWRHEHGTHWQFCIDDKFRPIHPHQELIDSYEPGQEWEFVAPGGPCYSACRGQPEWRENCQYRLKPAALPKLTLNAKMRSAYGRILLLLQISKTRFWGVSDD